MSLRAALAKQTLGIMVKGGYEEKTMSHLQLIDANPGTVNLAKFCFLFLFGHTMTRSYITFIFSLIKFIKFKC